MNSAANPSPEDARLLQALRRMTGRILFEFVALFDQLEDVQFWIKDRSGRFLWVNLCFLLNYGLKDRREAIGRTDFDLSDSSLAHHFRLDDEKVLGGDRIVSRIELVGQYNHEAIWCTTTKLPLRNARGRVVGTTGTTRPYRRGQGELRTEAPLSGALDLISRNYHRRITNAELAQAAGLSLRVFQRRFRQLYHSSPHDYLRQLRVRMSCQALVYGRKSLKEVAGEFGFSDQSHFTREFRRIIGETPRVYRSRYR